MKPITLFATRSLFKPSSVIITLIYMIFSLQPASAVADPLLDPWIKFCLMNKDAAEFGDCVDGLPVDAVREMNNKELQFTYALTLQIRPRDEAKAEFVCPHEFGSICHTMAEAIIALGGHCKDGTNNTVCELPPLPVPSDN